MPESDEDIRWSLNRLGEELFYDYIKILKSDKRNTDILDRIDELENRCRQILKEHHAYEISMLDITGRDLIELGISKGPKIGEVLEYLLKKVIENPSLNDNIKLSKLTKKFI